MGHGTMYFFKRQDFPGGPAVEKLPPKAGDTGLTPGWGTKTPQTSG